MHTLMDYFTYVKGVEYLIAIAFLLSFIVVWRIAGGRGKGRPGNRRAVSFYPVVIAGFVVVIAYRVTATPSPASLPVAEGEPRVFTFGSLVELYGPAAFDHALHQRVTSNCVPCHHHSGDTFPPCQQCHAASVSQEDLRKPDLARVYHRRCISCHREKDSGPLVCTGCHTAASIPPLSITHPLTARDKCLVCHTGKLPGAPRAPDDHAGASNGVCQLCHKPSAEVSSASTTPRPAPVLPEANLPQLQGIPTVFPTPRTVATLRHETSGRENCMTCHGPANLPVDHTGRGNETCLTCHKPQ